MPRKKRGSGFYHVKRGTAITGGRNRHSLGKGSMNSSGEEPNIVDSPCSAPDSHPDSDNSCTSSVFESACLSPEGLSQEADNVGGTLSSDQEAPPRLMSQNTSEEVPPLHQGKDVAVMEAVVTETLKTLIATIPAHWKVIQDRGGFHAFCLSRNSVKNISIQRVVYASFDGSIDIFVHRKEVLGALRNDIMTDILCVPLHASSVKVFADNVIQVVNCVRKYEICAGVDLTELNDLWAFDCSGKIDENPYGESRYDKTFRSHECSFLVPVKRSRCMECLKACNRQKQRKKVALKEELSKFTRNDYLLEDQKMVKLKSLQKEYKNSKRKIDHLQSQVTKLMNHESVAIDKDQGENLTEILRDSNLTPVQQLFIQQQCKSAECKSSKGMRWHPTMIRLALLIKSTCSAAYRALRDSGVINLPGERTLFDYEHAVSRSDGVFTDKLYNIGEKVQYFDSEYKKYFSLLMDEIHISKKLVYRKSDGRLIGYVKLDEVESEMTSLSQSIRAGVQCDNEPEVATKILAYMIKGCTNSVKEVIAAFTTGCLTKEQLFSKTWQVIRACEGVGVKILAVVCDGSSVNRAFIAMHTPATQTAHGVVFDTINMCALDRTLFFISDPPHLLKTIRNNFAKSGQSSKGVRLLTVNNEFIEWKSIVRLYLEDMQRPLRRCFKLNAQNVYLNSYTCMRVSYAAQVLSRTVALDLESRGWPKMASTVQYIRKSNDFFDCLNGAHTNSANMMANPRLASYVGADDERFQELKEFESYIWDWGEQVKNLQNVPDSQKKKMTLSDQTVEGIYMTVNGFTGAVKFLLSIGAQFVNARVFCHDPLEQYFSKQRASGGGRSSVSATSFFTSDIRISTHRDMNVHRKSANTPTTLTHKEVDESPLPKRPKK